LVHGILLVDRFTCITYNTSVQLLVVKFNKESGVFRQIWGGTLPGYPKKEEKYSLAGQKSSNTTQKSALSTSISPSTPAQFVTDLPREDGLWPGVDLSSNASPADMPEFFEHAQKVALDPAFGYFPILETEHIHAGEGYFPIHRRKSPKCASLGG
jgi:hypothetical protein